MPRDLPRLRGLRAVVLTALAASFALEAREAAEASSPERRLVSAPTPRGKPTDHEKGREASRPGRRASPRVRVVAQKKKPAPPPPLDGTSYDYDYDGREIGHPERRWMARAFVHTKAAAQPGQALPVLVFLHGNNAEAIKYRWMGGGNEGDVRRIVAEMIEAGLIPPMIVAAPSSIDPYTMTQAGLSWPSFDLDVFLDKTIARLGSAAIVDRGRVVVAAHSGGGCNIKGGLNSALHAKGTPILAGLSIDTCMMLDLAKELAHLRPSTHVVVSWQDQSWPERDFGGFKAVFNRESKKAPALPGILRELEYMQPNVGGAHDALVGITLRRWLPKLLPPPPPDLAPPDGGVPSGG